MGGAAGNDFSEFTRRYWRKDGGMPKHEILRQSVTAAIAEGYWPSGARLPTEAEWVAYTPCSLGTVQRALRALVDDGLIQRRRGSGTVVADFAPPLDHPLHMRFFQVGQGNRQMLPVTSRILSRKIIRHQGAWSDDVGQNGRPVVRLDRVMEVGDDLDVYSVFYAVADEFPELTKLPTQKLNGVDLKQILSNRSHNPLHRVRQLMRFEAPPDQVVAACRCWPDGANASILNVVGFGVDGRGMYYQDLYIPPTPYTLDLGAQVQTLSAGTRRDGEDN
ncbi:MAG: GntR family transcriptional regulator [Rhodospirillaceae bacterium]